MKMAAIDQEGKVDDAQRALLLLKEKGDQRKSISLSANATSDEKIEQLEMLQAT